MYVRMYVCEQVNVRVRIPMNTKDNGINSGSGGGGGGSWYITCRIGLVFVNVVCMWVEWMELEFS